METILNFSLFDLVTLPFIISIFLLILSLLYFLIFSKSKLWIQLKNVPGPKPYPIIGNALDFAVPQQELLNVISDYFAKYGKRILVGIGPTPRVLLADRYDVEKLLSSQIHINKSDDYDLFVNWLGFGLLTSNRQKWFHRRKLLTPAFHFGILTTFMDVFNEQCKILTTILSERFANGKEFDIFPLITNCAIDIISETAMGTKLNVQCEPELDYVRAISRTTELLMKRTLSPWYHPEFIWRITPEGREEAKCLRTLHSFTQKVIAEKKAAITNSNAQPNVSGSANDAFKAKKRLAFLDLLLEVQAEQMASNGQFSDSDIQEEVDTFMFEGHDTTAANIMFTLYLLATYLENQKLVQEELDNIFMNDPNRAVTTEDLTKMKYLECCIKESLRIYPSVPVIARAIEEDLKLDDKVTLPKGTSLTIPPYFLHRDPEIFPDPEAFCPERFFPENANGRHPFAYVPFSAGPRNCIGQKFAMMEVKVVLSSLFRRFTFATSEKRENLKLCVNLILRQFRPILVSLTTRTPINHLQN